MTTRSLVEGRHRITKTKTRLATQFGLQLVPVHDLSTTIDKRLLFKCRLAESCVSCLAYRPCLVSSCVDKLGLGVGDIVDGACHNALVGTNTDRNNVVSIVRQGQRCRRGRRRMLLNAAATRDTCGGAHEMIGPWVLLRKLLLAAACVLERAVTTVQPLGSNRLPRSLQ